MIAVGTRLGPYEILSHLGAGGMGEVYRAKDTRLNRTVAIKVLPGQISDRADLRQRFEREARAVSSLNHPHICTLYDIGHQDGIDYLVMEYLEGETLAQRLTKGALPLDQALRYAIEIADALDQAHRHGVTHRDLKPGNVMLNRSGAKLLDFGLAKLRSPEPVWSGHSSLPTEAGALTEKGSLSIRSNWQRLATHSPLPRKYLATPFNEYWGRLSPDGRWMAYISNETGRDEVYVRPSLSVEEGCGCRTAAAWAWSTRPKTTSWATSGR